MDALALWRWGSDSCAMVASASGGCVMGLGGGMQRALSGAFVILWLLEDWRRGLMLMGVTWTFWMVR